MKIGTPGFSGAALREAREARGLSASSLADLLGVTRSAVSQYELAIQSPRPEVLERICLAMNLPGRFFFKTDGEAAFKVIFHRSIGSSGKVARLKADRRLGWLRNIVGYLKEFVEFPDVNLPAVGFPSDPARIRTEDIESAALDVRRLIGAGDTPIGNVISLLENNGLIVARDEMDIESLDSVCAWDSSLTPFIIVAAHVRSAASSRYEVARCLGHLVLHRTMTQAQLAANNHHALVKAQASLFSRAFLLPRNTFLNDLYSVSLDAMRIIKQRWKTPIAAMIQRLEDLDVVNSDQAKKLWIGRSRRKWLEMEPLDDEVPLERPRLLSESISLVVDERVQTKQDILDALPYSDRDIELLAGLQVGYLTDTMPVISIIPASSRSSDQPKERSSNAPVVLFPESGTPPAKQRKIK